MLLTAPSILLTGIVTLVAALLYTYMGIAVGRMRGKHQIAAPAMTGHPELERAIRVHLNTLESLPVFLAALWLAAIYFHPLAVPFSGWIAPVLGIIWIIGRIIYMQSYMANPDTRGRGFVFVAISQLILILLGLIGIVTAWMAAG